MTTGTPSDPRVYATFLRGPAGVNTFCFGTLDELRVALWHAGVMSVFVEPQDIPPDDFGIIPGGGFTVELADEDAFGGIDGLGADWYILQEDGSRLLLETGPGALIVEY